MVVDVKLVENVVEALLGRRGEEECGGVRGAMGGVGVGGRRVTALTGGRLVVL